jgi:hypothetical protein
MPRDRSLMPESTMPFAHPSDPLSTAFVKQARPMAPMADPNQRGFVQEALDIDEQIARLQELKRQLLSNNKAK